MTSCPNKAINSSHQLSIIILSQPFNDLSVNLKLGISHVKDDRFENGYIRTPLGAFVNHSDAPNCEFYNDSDFIKLRTIRNINGGHELTAEYWLYEMVEDDSWVAIY